MLSLSLSLVAFLVGIESVSRKIAIEPVLNKKQESWEAAIRRMLELTYSDIHLLITDRDVIASKQFRQQIFDSLRIRWAFIRIRSKSWMVERAIPDIKKRYSIAMQLNNTTNWVQFTDDICQHYNRQYIPSTNLRRFEVDKMNYLSVLEQLYKTRKPALQFNTFSLGHFPKKMETKLFKYPIGTKVLLSRKVSYKMKTHVFEKPSVIGYWGDTIYEISDLKLKHGSKWTLVPVYQLRNAETKKILKGYYYGVEIMKVEFD